MKYRTLIQNLWRKIGEYCGGFMERMSGLYSAISCRNPGHIYWFGNGKIFPWNVYWVLGENLPEY